MEWRRRERKGGGQMSRVYDLCVKSYIGLTAVGQKLRRLGRDEEGQGMVEYGLIIGLVAIAVVVALVALTGGLNNIFAAITKTLSGASGS